MIERVSSTSLPQMPRLKMPPEQHRSTFCDYVACARRDMG